MCLLHAGTKNKAEVQWYFAANNSKPLIFTNSWELKEAVSVVTEPEVISLSSSVQFLPLTVVNIKVWGGIVDSYLTECNPRFP